MFETLGFENLTPAQAATWFALGLGVAFGVLAQITRFCLRRAVVGDDRQSAAGVWLMALAVAILGTQAAVAMGLIEFSDHRFMASDLPIAAILLGGLAFGAGMVLTRGCISRLTVLGASGNTRAVLMLVVFAILAHATLKGVLAPMRVALGQITLSLPSVALPGTGLIWAVIIAVPCLFFALRSANRPVILALAALIGALVPLAWVTTGYVLYDEFDPIAKESLAFTSSAADALFYTIASTAVAPSFGAALIAGVLVGAALSALARKEFAWASFESAAQTGRYVLGAALMGVGGVLAGGCTVGAGLSGIPTLSIAAILAVAAMIAGAWATHRLLHLNKGQAPVLSQPA